MYLYNGVPSNNEEKLTSDTCQNMKEPQKHAVKETRHERLSFAQFHVCECPGMSRTGQSIKTRKHKQLAGLGEEIDCKGQEGAFVGNGNVLELDRGDGRTNA